MFQTIRRRAGSTSLILVLSAVAACEHTSDAPPDPGASDPPASGAAGPPANPIVDATTAAPEAPPPGETGSPGGTPGAEILTSNAGTWRVSYELLREGPVPLNEPFGMKVSVTTAGGEHAGDVGLAVDAGMPEHEHGMNTRTIVKTGGGPGRFEVDGLLFHMPGRWELYFDVVRDGVIERAQDEIVLD